MTVDNGKNIDEIIGFIHSKDLAKFLCGGENFSVTKILRKILFVPGSMKLLDVMLRMRMARVHVAIVMDEFGGIDGITTIENIMEEIELKDFLNKNQAQRNERPREAPWGFLDLTKVPQEEE